MADFPQPPKKPTPPRKNAEPPRKPLQVLHISKKEEQRTTSDKSLEQSSDQPESASLQKKNISESPIRTGFKNEEINLRKNNIEEEFPPPMGISMGDLLGPPGQKKDFREDSQVNDYQTTDRKSRSVDDFDFDEDAFLAALDENEPIGSTGEIAKGSVIGVESDGVYVDIGGKAPGFMPKKECGLGVITNIKEKFPKGLTVEVLVTREQNADGMVTLSCRALALRKSWETLLQLEKSGELVTVKINGFNRGGVTCDLEGLRGFIPRSQLEDGENHQNLVGSSISVAFLEVNPDTRKLVLSQKKAALISRFRELELGQLVEGKVAAIKPYGFFIDLGGISGLLHQSMITNGSLRSLREVFKPGDEIKAIITELNISRGRIALNTALLEGLPGEIISDKETLMNEAEERSELARQRMNETIEKESIEKQKNTSEGNNA